MHIARALTRLQMAKDIEGKKQLPNDIPVDTVSSRPKPRKDVRTKTKNDPTEPVLRADTTQAHHTPPTQTVMDSAASDAPHKRSRHKVENLFSGRQLKDCTLLSKLGKSMQVTSSEDDIPSVGKLVNRRQGRCKPKQSRIIHPESVIGMDVGCSPAASPGGHKHTLISVDHCTSHTWMHGMGGTSGNDIQEELWKFFIDANGFLESIQCDFDLQFVGSKA